MRKTEALLVSDCPEAVPAVERALEGLDFALTVVREAEQGFQVIKERRIEVALIDLALSGTPGLALVVAVRGLPRPPEVVVLAGPAELDTAVRAIKAGAFYYLSKPVENFRLATTLKNAAAKYRLDRENAALRHNVAEHRVYTGSVVVAESLGMRRALKVIDRVAPSDASVLIRGEAGAGKALIAKLIHNRSARSAEPRLSLNCGAIQESLLEGELFGHEKGAVAGAAAAKPGLFEIADGGTLFLDEVGEIGLALQAKLLQVLDSGELRRLGGTTPTRVDVRVVSASDKDLEHECAEGRFRRDLLFKLSVVTLALPPLRERREDIPGLVQIYLERHRLPGRSLKSVSQQAMAALCDYRWPGNVRELAHVIEGLVLLTPGDEIGLEDLPALLGGGQGRAEGADREPELMAEVQKRHIQRTLRYTRGKKAPAARLLGIDVKTLYNKIRKYGIEV